MSNIPTVEYWLAEAMNTIEKCENSGSIKKERLGLYHFGIKITQRICGRRIARLHTQLEQNDRAWSDQKKMIHKKGKLFGAQIRKSL